MLYGMKYIDAKTLFKIYKIYFFYIKIVKRHRAKKSKILIAGFLFIRWPFQTISKRKIMILINRTLVIGLFFSFQMNIYETVFTSPTVLSIFITHWT